MILNIPFLATLTPPSTKRFMIYERSQFVPVNNLFRLTILILRKYFSYVKYLNYAFTFISWHVTFWIYKNIEHLVILSLCIRQEMVNLSHMLLHDTVEEEVYKYQTWAPIFLFWKVLRRFITHSYPGEDL